MVFDDNGTKLVAVEQELRKALQEQVKQHKEIQANMSCQKIEWHFCPPHGPHFGRVWERIVQYCKRAMEVSVVNRLVSDRVLKTAIAEVEDL